MLQCCIESRKPKPSPNRNRMPTEMSAPRHPHPSHATHASQPLFSLLGSSIGGRLTIAATVCALLWAVILWALT
jgi:hypothetical protein